MATDTTQLTARITEERQLTTQMLNLINAARGQVRRWELGEYGTGLTDQKVHDAGFPTKSKDDVQNGINAFAAFVALYDSTWGNPMESISS